MKAEQFKQILEKINTGSYERFIANLELYGFDSLITVEGVLSMYDKWSYVSSFDWTISPEGYSYWAILDEHYREAIRGLK